MHAAWSDAAPAIGMHGCVGPSVTARGVQHITPARAADTAPMLRLWSWQCELLPAVSSRGPLTLQLEELIGARDGDGAVDVEELRALLRGGVAERRRGRFLRRMVLLLAALAMAFLALLGAVWQTPQLSLGHRHDLGRSACMIWGRSACISCIRFFPANVSLTGRCTQVRPSGGRFLVFDISHDMQSTRAMLIFGSGKLT